MKQPVISLDDYFKFVRQAIEFTFREVLDVKQFVESTLPASVTQMDKKASLLCLFTNKFKLNITLFYNAEDWLSVLGKTEIAKRHSGSLVNEFLLELCNQISGLLVRHSAQTSFPLSFAYFASLGNFREVLSNVNELSFQTRAFPMSCADFELWVKISIFELDHFDHKELNKASHIKIEQAGALEIF